MRVKTLLKRKSRSVVTAKPSTSIDAAMEMLITNKIGCLPVLSQAEGLRMTQERLTDTCHHAVPSFVGTHGARSHVSWILANNLGG